MESKSGVEDEIKDKLARVEIQIKKLEDIDVALRTGAQNNLLTGYLATRNKY